MTSLALRPGPVVDGARIKGASFGGHPVAVASMLSSDRVVSFFAPCAKVGHLQPTTTWASASGSVAPGGAACAFPSNGTSLESSEVLLSVSRIC